MVPVVVPLSSLVSLVFMTVSFQFVTLLFVFDDLERVLSLSLLSRFCRTSKNEEWKYDAGCDTGVVERWGPHLSRTESE